MLNKVVILLPLCSVMFTCAHLTSVNTTDDSTEEDSPIASELDTDNYWTRWFDVDDPGTGTGDYETTNSITSHLGTSICPSTHRISQSQCRDVGFDYDDGDMNSDYLYRPCTQEGLICRNRDQPSGLCNDYQIRFYCIMDDGSDDGGGTSIRFDMRIYIILAAIPVAIFFLRICWSCTFDRRRQRGSRSEPRGSRDREDSIQIDPEVFMPPPTYSELFGQGRGPFVLSRHFSLCSKCRTSRCIVFRNRCYISSERRRSQTSGNTETTQGTPETSSETPETSSEILATAAATDANSPVNVEVNNGATSITENDLPLNTNSSSDNVDCGAATATLTADSDAVVDVDSASESNTDRSETCNAAQCDCPCHKHVPDVLAYDNPSFTPEVEIQDGRSRRLPGMHLSVFSLFRYPSTSPSTEPPPPTYKEALKILKKNQKGTS